MRRALAWAAAIAAAIGTLASCDAFRISAPASTEPRPFAWSDRDVAIAYLGHATVLVGFQGTNLLFDPAFFERIGPSLGDVTIGPKRLVATALPPERLPRIDAVVLSHAHMDHLDLPSLRAVRSTPLVVTAERTTDVLAGVGFARVVELRWGESLWVGDLAVEAFEPRHWGRRWPWDAWRGYNGYVLTKNGQSVVVLSDTAYTKALEAVGRRFRLVAAVLGIGAYDPWIWNHANPEQAWQMFRESGADVLVPVHWDVFRLGREPLGEAMKRLLAAAGESADRVVVRRVGESWRQRAAATSSASSAALR